MRIGGVIFRVYAGDHEGALIPHVHAEFDRGEVLLELLDDGTVRFSEVHRSSVIGNDKRSDIRKAVKAAKAAFDLLFAEWKEMRP